MHATRGFYPRSIAFSVLHFFCGKWAFCNYHYLLAFCTPLSFVFWRADRRT